MINLLSETVCSACAAHGIDVEFTRIPDKCKPLAPYFVFVVKGYPTHVGLNTQVFHDNKKPIGEFINELINTILTRINEIIATPTT